MWDLDAVLRMEARMKDAFGEDKVGLGVSIFDGVLVLVTIVVWTIFAVWLFWMLVRVIISTRRLPHSTRHLSADYGPKIPNVAKGEAAKGRSGFDISDERARSIGDLLDNLETRSTARRRRDVDEDRRNGLDVKDACVVT